MPGSRARSIGWPSRSKRRCGEPTVRLRYTGSLALLYVAFLRKIQELKKKHGIDYDSHASYRFVEE